MQVSRESRVRELCRSIVVVDKVDATCCGVSDLPAWWQRTQLLTVHIAQVPEQRQRKTLETMIQVFTDIPVRKKTTP